MKPMQPMSYDFKSRRSMVMARRGMVAASNPLAAQAGLSVLRQGGNAADAAIATAAMMNVTAPASTGVGGDCFALYFDAQTGEVSALNGSGRAPAALNLEDLLAEGWTEFSRLDARAVTVPGAVAGWHDLLERHGTMSLADVLADAIYYAGEGYPVSPVFADLWGGSESFLQGRPNTDDYLPDGQAPRVGQIVRLPALASTLQAIAEGGPQAFYEGPIADAIVSTLQAQGGVMSHDDLKTHQSTWDNAISTDYRGVTVYECPPNGQGLAALQALNVAEGWDLGEQSWDAPQRLHLMVEAMRLAFADARQYVADMNSNPAPLDLLLSKQYAAERRALVSRRSAMQPPSYGRPVPASDTIYLSVVDGQGNVCSFINSLYSSKTWGTGIVAKGTGVFLQNRGSNFSLDPDHPNCVAPGKRPYHTIIPGMALRDGELWASFGVMGGFMQPQGHFQVISAMLDDNLNPQEALDRPRFCLIGGTSDSILALEDGIPDDALKRLGKMGHNVERVSGAGRSLFGSGQIIRRDAETGVLYGGSDPRKDGLVAAF